MFLARVVGTVWSSVKWQGLQGLRLLLVRPYHLRDLLDVIDGSASPDTEPERIHDGVVVADVLGAGPGEDVVIAYGHAARVAVEPDLEPMEKPHFPIDAAVVAIVDRFVVHKNSLGDADGKEGHHRG
jgi:ethanolamine utilization protein EutN